MFKKVVIKSKIHETIHQQISRMQVLGNQMKYVRVADSSRSWREVLQAPSKNVGFFHETWNIQGPCMERLLCSFHYLIKN